MGEEAKQEAEAKQEENKEKKTEETKPGPAPSVVLSLDLHCVGCAKKIEKCMLKCTGVESVEVDMVKNQVTVKGVVDSQSLCSRIHKRTRRKVQVVSQPTAETEGDSMPEVVPPQESSMATIELLVYMHCEICAELLKRKILKMKGVQTAETDTSAGRVTVTGTMTVEKLVEYIHRRTGKLATAVPPPPQPRSEEEKKEQDKTPEEENKEEKKDKEKAPEGQGNGDDTNGDAEKEKTKESEEIDTTTIVGQEDMMRRMMYWHGNFIREEEMAQKTMMHGMPVLINQPPPPPQFFSDENPNACCIT
ncbi:heavy metal-associated isoprenylated plant protein 9-like [Zingiber officinale]|uniref:HMA domain-containing protein n=1 Tax=Zingiber officinale TaxID=94328 RepID=A0A8J5F1T7_ZINOF|nr:heavy metal-associated isoprenylated plant protein 9-like [Zingiber officinale]KAG6476616.1 hypothetical protein ZIOFF_065861 [Zingiber officinale]